MAKRLVVELNGKYHYIPVKGIFRAEDHPTDMWYETADQQGEDEICSFIAKLESEHPQPVYNVTLHFIADGLHHSQPGRLELCDGDYIILQRGKDG